MLEFIYYPVSFILWCWHQVFGFVFEYDSAIAWVLAIAFLTFTVRGIMFKPFVNQVRSMKKMQDFAPEMKKVQKKYANDKQRQAQEMQKLQREHGVNPLGSCLPMLLQIPVFIGLNWVLRAFNYNPNPGPKTENYFFGQQGVQSYLNADIFGINIGDAIHRIARLGGQVTQNAGGWDWSVGKVAFPLAIVAAIATHFTARHSAQRQTAAQSTGQAKMMQNVTMWIFPLGLLVIGAFVPVGLLIYFLSNNAWTLMQQRFIYSKIDREDEAKKAEAVEKRTALAPKPGQKPAAGQKPAPGQSGKSTSGQQSGQKSTPKDQQKAGKPATNKGGGAGSGGSWAKGGGATRTSSAPPSKSGNQQNNTGSGKSNATGKTNGSGKGGSSAKAGGSANGSGKSDGSGKSNGSGKQNTASSKKSGRKRR